MKYELTCPQMLRIKRCRRGIKNYLKKQLYPKRYTLSPNKGFTLIELLVVIVVMAIVGTIVGSILFSSLRDSNKTSNINELRTNGTYSLSQMTKIIQGAKKVISTDELPSCSSGTDSLTITNFNNTISTISATNDFIYFAPLLLTPTISFNNSKVEIHDGNNCTSNSTAIFSCKSNDFGPPTIIINFSMNFNTSSTFAEQKVCVPFQTTVSPRNFGQ